MAWFRKALFGSLAAAALAGAVLWAFREKPVPVEVGTVTRGLFRVTVEEDAKTRVRNRYVVSAPLAGRVLRSDLKPGDPIAQGAVVATLLPSLPPLLEARTRRELEERVGGADATMREAEVRLERATAQEIQARADAERIRSLNQKGIASAQQLEREELTLRLAQRDRDASELRHHAAEHELAQAKALLKRYDEPASVERWDVTAPVGGRVLKVLQESETVVSAGAALAELGDPGDLEVTADILTSDAVEIRPGAAVSIERWGGPSPLAGVVRLVEPAGFTKTSALGVEEQRVWVVIDLVSPRSVWTGLGDAFRVDVRITLAEIPDATIVPSSALFRRGDGWAAFVVDAGRARERSLHIVGRTSRQAAVASGLEVGQAMVVFPPASLADGRKVIPR